VLGLLADLPRKNCWTSAERAGDLSPDGMGAAAWPAVWDHDAVRDEAGACACYRHSTELGLLMPTGLAEGGRSPLAAARPRWYSRLDDWYSTRIWRWWP
jgi:hypothetical protein